MLNTSFLSCFFHAMEGEQYIPVLADCQLDNLCVEGLMLIANWNVTRLCHLCSHIYTNVNFLVGPHHIGPSWLSPATAWSWSISLSGQYLVKTWQKPVTTIKACIDKRNCWSDLAWDTAYGHISRFLASDSARTKASSVKRNVTSFSVGGAVNLSQNSFMGRP